MHPHSTYTFGDATLDTWLDYGAIRGTDVEARIAQNVIVPVSAWGADTQYIFTDYPYKADISMADVTADDFPIIVFDAHDAIAGNYCPVAYSFAGKVVIFAREVPMAAITLPAITFISFGG